MAKVVNIRKYCDWCGKKATVAVISVSNHKLGEFCGRCGNLAKKQADEWERIYDVPNYGVPTLQRPKGIVWTNQQYKDPYPQSSAGRQP